LLQATDGVKDVRVNPRTASRTVLYDPSGRTHTELLAALEQAGCLQCAALPGPPKAGAVRRNAQRENLAGTFGKALMGALAQRTATRLIGALL
jgi:hypothetical protein